MPTPPLLTRRSLAVAVLAVLALVADRFHLKASSLPLDLVVLANVLADR